MKKSEYEDISSEIRSHLFKLKTDDSDEAIKSDILDSILMRHIDIDPDDEVGLEFKTAAERGVWIREKILSTIISYIEINGYPPTIREICERVGLASTSSVCVHLQKMDTLGMIVLGDNCSPRAIRIPGYKIVKE